MSSFMGGSAQNEVQGRKVYQKTYLTKAEPLSFQQTSTTNTSTSKVEKSIGRLNVLSIESLEVSGEQLERFMSQVIQGKGLFCEP